MSRLHAASVLFLLLPQGFAAPLIPESFLPSFQLFNASSVVAAPTVTKTGDVSVQTDPIVVAESVLPTTPKATSVVDVSPLPLDGSDIFVDPLLPIPIEPGIGDGSGPEAYGDPSTPENTTPTEAFTPTDTILPFPYGDEEFPPPRPFEIPNPRPIGQPTISVETFVSIIQQIAEVLGGFFSVSSGLDAPPLLVVAADVAPFLAQTAAAADSDPTSGPVLESRQLPGVPALPLDTLIVILKTLTNVVLGLLTNTPVVGDIASKVPLTAATNALGGLGGLGKRETLRQAPRTPCFSRCQQE
jgi:hypothetical protein